MYEGNLALNSTRDISKGWTVTTRERVTPAFASVMSSKFQSKLALILVAAIQ